MRHARARDGRPAGSDDPGQHDIQRVHFDHSEPESAFTIQRIASGLSVTYRITA
jgi:hypothetical protein